MAEIIFGVQGPEWTPFALNGLPMESISLALSPDGATLYAGASELDLGSKEGVAIQRWETSTRKLLEPIRAGHEKAISALAVSPDGRRLYSGDWAGVLATWDLSQGRRVRRVYAHNAGVGSLAVMPDGTVVTGAGGTGNYIELAPGVPPADSTVRLWDPESGQARAKLIGHTGYVDKLLIDGARSLILSGSRDGTVRVWSPPQAEAVAVLAGGVDEIRALALSDDGRRLYVGGNEPLLYEWDMTWMLLPPAKRLRMLEEETGLGLESYEVRRRESWDLVAAPQPKPR